jgi:ubiquinol-cytochrome c reductase cytochrome b subunit
MAVVLVMCCWGAAAGAPAGQLSGDYLGAELGSPPDPGEAYAAARPDWYFVGLYQFAHYFSGASKIVPIFVVPTLVIVYLLAMPFIGRRRTGHRVNVAATVALGAALAVLTGVSKYHDAADEGHQASLAAAEQDAVRVKQLIRAQGIPAAGAMALLWEDPKTQGPKLFRQHCASCHDHADAEGNGILAQDPTAPNLYRFASVEWLTGLLDSKQIAYAPPIDQQTGKPKCTPTDRPKYFGGSEKLKKADMADFVKGSLKELRREVGEEEFRTLIKALAAEASRKPGEAASKETRERIGDFTCFDCHPFHVPRKTEAGPNLTGYGSRDWLMAIISDPASNRFYGKNNDRMPSYAKSPDKAEENVLSAGQIELLADWLRGVWFEE